MVLRIQPSILAQVEEKDAGAFSSRRSLTRFVQITLDPVNDDLRLRRLLCGKASKLLKNRVVGAALVAALGQPSRACGTPTARRQNAICGWRIQWFYVCASAVPPAESQ